jgi:hypothetical protein
VTAPPHRPPSPGTGRGAGRDVGQGAGPAVAVIAVCLLAALAVVQWAGRPWADGGSASFAEVEAAVGDAGLQVCAADQHPSSARVPAAQPPEDR